jgi:protein O-mannosyl-transferase
MSKSSRKKKAAGYDIVNKTTSESFRVSDKSDDRQFLDVKLIRDTRATKYLLAGLVSLITLLVYLPSLRNEFVWDDALYVTNNIIIRSFNLGLIKSAFLEFHAANWHPITWFSHAIDYAIWGLNPVGHHLTSVILHSLNSAVVVFVVIRLLALYRNRSVPQMVSPWLKERSILITGSVTGLLFALHPVHVESVAWVAERKDLLCALFFLLSILAYTKYVSVIDNESAQKTLKLRFLNKHYLFTLGFFVLALLSKPMAVSLPCILLLLDWYPFSRSQSFKSFRTVFFEKLPFIAFSLISCILTILAQKAGRALGLMEFVPFSTRALVAAKSLFSYLWEIIFPMNLIPFYPYPMHVSFSSLDYLSAGIFAVGITAACVIIVNKQKLFLSVWGYYVITLIPVLGLVQVGVQSMADRYAYLPSLGPFLMIGLAMAWSWSRVNAFRRKTAVVKLFGISVFMLLCAAMMYLTFKQIGIWKDDMTLWSYAIEKQSEPVPIAYYNRALVFYNTGKFDKAIQDYDKAIAWDPSWSGVYYNRGLVYDKMGNLDKAIEDYDKAIALNPSWSQVYYNRGIVFDKMGKIDKALENFDRAIALNPSDPNAYNNRGAVFYKMGKIDKALENFDRAIALNPSWPQVYYNRGMVFYNMGKFDKTIADFQKACDLGFSEGCRAVYSLTR